MAKIKKINHLGIAIQDVKKARAFWQELGLHCTHEEEVKSDFVKTIFYPVGESFIELLEATSPDSPVQKYLDKRGPGIHHLCLEVEDIQGLLTRLKEKGVQLIDEKPRPGAHGCQVAFVHPKSTGGILLELSETQGLGGKNQKR